MANEYRVKKVYDMPPTKAYAIYLAEEVAGIKGPMAQDDLARPVMANMTYAEAKSYAKELNSGKSLEDVRYQRQRWRNMMYSGMS